MDSVKEYGQEVITTEKGHRIGIVTIIGEIEGHTLLAANAKTTKYEHMIPLLIGMENDASVDGILFVLNTIGGDVECGLAMAELIAAIQKPTISLVIGGSHSIGIPLAVATDCSFYRAVRDYAGTSGTDEWNRTGSTPDLLSIQPDAGADHWFHL